MFKLPFTKNKNILVVEIGKASLKMVSFLRSSAKLELSAYSLEKIDPEADSASQIVRAIRVFLKKNSLSVKEAVLSIADSDSLTIKYCLLPALKQG